MLTMRLCGLQADPLCSLPQSQDSLPQSQHLTCKGVLRRGPRTFTVLQVEQALQMAGGGLYEVVGPGQGTDDTEATLCLAHALATSTSPHLPLEAIAQNYSDWAADTRLDIGGC